MVSYVGCGVSALPFLELQNLAHIPEPYLDSEDAALPAGTRAALALNEKKRVVDSLRSTHRAHLCRGRLVGC